MGWCTSEAFGNDITWYCISLYRNYSKYAVRILYYENSYFGTSRDSSAKAIP